MEFEAKFRVLATNATSITPNYQAVLHCGVIMQAVKFVDIKSGGILRGNDRSRVRLRFIERPEYL